MIGTIEALVVGVSLPTWLFLAKICIKIGKLESKLETIDDHEERIRKIEEWRYGYGS